MSVGVRSDLSNMILRQIKLKSRELYDATIKVQGLDEADLKSININGWEGLYNVKPKSVPENVITKIVDDKLGGAGQAQTKVDDRLVFRPSHRKNPPEFKNSLDKIAYIKSLPENEHGLRHDLRQSLSGLEWKMLRDGTPEEIEAELQRKLTDQRKRESARIEANRVHLETIDGRLEAAKETFLGIPADTPTAKLTADQIDAINLINKYGDKSLKSGTVKRTRTKYDPTYNKFSNMLEELYGEVSNLADLKGFKKDTPENRELRSKWVNENSWERGHLIPKTSQPHMRNVNSNISGENAVRNNKSGAFYTLAEYAENMDRSSIKAPLILQREMDELASLIKSAKAEGYDTTKLQDLHDRFGAQYKFHTSNFKKNDPASKIKIFNNLGEFRSYEDIKGTGGINSKEDYEKLRRLFITMASNNPEWDLDGYLKTKNLPKEFIDGFNIGDYKNASGRPSAVPLDVVASSNAEVGRPYFSTKQSTVDAIQSTNPRITGKAKAGAGILGFLASISAPFAKMLPFAGVPFAADEAVRSWDEGNYIRSGVNALDAVTLGVTPLGFVDAGFEVAEQNGSMQADMDAARAQAGVTSAADVARQRALLLKNIWTNDD